MKKGILLLFALIFVLIISLSSLSYILLSEDNSEIQRKRESISEHSTINDSLDEDRPVPEVESEPLVDDVPNKGGGSSSRGGGSESADNTREANAETSGILISDSWKDFYGEIDAEIGDEILAFDKSKNLLGAFEITKKGEYGFLHVYTPSELSLTQDSLIYFYLYDKPGKERFLGENALGAEETFRLDFHNP